jgi:hypothetical protein
LFKGRERAVTERDPVEDGDYTRDARRLRVSLWLLAVERQHLDVREKDVPLLKTGWTNLV